MIESGNREPKYIAFATQKGGVGKSVFSVLMASMLHYRLGCNLLVVDCDYPQYSIHQMRERDVTIIDLDSSYRLLYTSQQELLQKPPYTILCSPAERAIEVVNAYLKSTSMSVDVVIFDLPGTIKSAGVLQSIAAMDHIFTPIISDRIVLESSLSFALTIKQMLVDNPAYPIGSIHLFWNMVDERERTHLYDLYNERIAEMGLPLLQTTLPDSKRYKKELHKDGKPSFRSTLLPPHKRVLKGSRFDQLLEEIINIINLPHNEQ